MILEATSIGVCGPEEASATQEPFDPVPQHSCMNSSVTPAEVTSIARPGARLYLVTLGLCP